MKIDKNTIIEIELPGQPVFFIKIRNDLTDYDAGVDYSTPAKSDFYRPGWKASDDGTQFANWILGEFLVNPRSFLHFKYMFINTDVCYALLEAFKNDTGLMGYTGYKWKIIQASLQL